MIEEWRDIVGYEGLYQVSNMGRVRSLNYNKTGVTKIMKHSMTKGYHHIMLSKNGKVKRFRVHRLVAQAFIPNPQGLPDINHKDENKNNNCIDNLEWCTKDYNNNYSFNKNIIGVNMSSGLILEFDSIKNVGDITGINNSNICSCCNGKRNSAGGWRWLLSR